MDTDSLPSSPALILFLSLFAYLSLAQYSGHLVSAPFAASLQKENARSSSWAGFTISALKYASGFAILLSALALMYSFGVSGWLPVAFLASGLLALLLVIDRLAAAIAARRPAAAARWTRPLFHLLPGGLSRKPSGHHNGMHPNSANSEGEEPHRDTLPPWEEPSITEAELESLGQRDWQMMKSILRLDVTTAREIMTPRLDVVAVEADGTLEQAALLMLQEGHSRLPVYEEIIDRIVGVVHCRDVLAALIQQDQETRLRDVMRPAFFIPETKRLDDLLDELQGRGLQMAIVVDEYGGTEGLVTMEDVLEEIVGEIEDEFSCNREAEVVRLPDGAVMVDAGVTTEHVEELFGTRLESPDVDTVGGYVYRTLGRIPQAGDVVVADHLRIEVVSILGRRLRKLRIDRTNGESAAPGE